MFFKDQGASRDLSSCPLSLRGLKTITFPVKGWGWHLSKHWASLQASAKHHCVPGTQVTATLFQCLPSAPQLATSGQPWGKRNTPLSGPLVSVSVFGSLPSFLFSVP